MVMLLSKPCRSKSDCDLCNYVAVNILPTGNRHLDGWVLLCHLLTRHFRWHVTRFGWLLPWFLNHNFSGYFAFFLRKSWKSRFNFNLLMLRSEFHQRSYWITNPVFIHRFHTSPVFVTVHIGHTLHKIPRFLHLWREQVTGANSRIQMCFYTFLIFLLLFKPSLVSLWIALFPRPTTDTGTVMRCFQSTASLLLITCSITVLCARMCACGWVCVKWPNRTLLFSTLVSWSLDYQRDKQQISFGRSVTGTAVHRRYTVLSSIGKQITDLCRPQLSVNNN